MRERPHDGPLPSASPVPGARPRHPDGDRVPCPPRPARAPLTRRRYAYRLGAMVVVLLLLMIWIVR
ncbi:hypothetical protein GCM10011608_33500 [Micromonospora sonchi]|uniref:Uncharacterized protein n=1 Tax=Micromonospora sonchi TaxID=1763543 RepID=A0A917X066_9ACTN|nr:hypothetical protein [Micromonospora sonchi]GGM46030.1 hypothetical protein GCM10011608_33500 [Micromonospora sonchi]